MSDDSVHERILALFSSHEIAFELIEHTPAATAEQAAAARGTDLTLGTKAILFKFDDAFGIFAMSAERAVHSAKIRHRLGVRRTRFASAEELLEMTGLAPGAVPPFGEPVLPFPLYLDPSVVERDSMLFTAGSRRLSIALKTRDYLAVANPVVFPFVR